MNWNCIRGSNSQGKCSGGSGIPNVARSWYEDYEGDSREEAIIGDSFYFADVVDGVVFLKELNLSDGALLNETSFDEVSLCNVSADGNYVAVGGRVLSSCTMKEVFNQLDINENASPEMITDITVVNDVFYCSRGFGEGGVAVVNGEDPHNVALIDRAKCFMSCDGDGASAFYAQGGVLFLDNDDEYFLRKPVDGIVYGGFFSGDGCFYIHIDGNIFLVDRCSDGERDIVHLCDVDGGFADFFVYKENMVVVNRERMVVDVYDRLSGEHIHCHPIKVNKIVSGFMRGGIYYSNYDHYPVAYDVMSGELVWRSEDRVTTSKVIGTSKAVIYKFVGGGYQCYYMG